MPKNIVLLSDGTGNSAGKLQKTNVWRLYDALDLPQPNAPHPPSQIAYYDDGVGSSSFRPYAILGGAIGLGLKRNVIDLYMFLCWNYRQGDRIYAFGFSRGAFTIRVLVGLVNDQGLVKAESWDELQSLARDAYRQYRKHYRTFVGIQTAARKVRDVVGRVRSESEIPTMDSPPMTFVGVWDTVSAYGLPFDELTRAWNFIMPLSVPDRNVCPNVERACHALSLDDERQTFLPVLWNEEGLADKPHIHDERLTQVWFPGVHANVGGGYPDDGLANVPLHWMMSEAVRRGLRLKPDALRNAGRAGDVYGRLYDPRRGLGGFYRYLPRKIARLADNQNPWKESDRVRISRPKIHESVFQRIANDPDGYAPIGIPARYAVVGSDGTIHDLPAPILPAFVREGRTEGAARAAAQERVWDLVWWRRIAYFLSVCAALFLVAFPLFYPALQACQQPLCWMTPAIDALAFVLPDFTAPLLHAYSTNPLEFCFALAALIASLVASSRLQAHIRTGMRRIWGVPPSAARDAGGGLLRTVRESRVYRWIWRHTQQTVLPFLVTIVVAWLAVAAFSQVLFAFRNAGGGICSPSTHPSPLREFDVSELCWASGVKLEEGVRYRIVLRVKEPWRDGVAKDSDTSPIAADLRGFGFDRMRPMMVLGLPFKRYVTEKWFKTIARIGSTGTDEYVLEPGDIFVDDRGKTLITEINARSSGELFLFVNDAVFGWMPSQQSTYANNRGTASVSVESMHPSHRLK